MRVTRTVPCHAQITLQPLWRQQAKQALEDPSASAATKRAAEDITCTNGDPFHMLMKQLNTVIIDWIESGVNNLVIYPINRDLIHTTNHLVDEIDQPIAEIKKVVDGAGEVFEGVGSTIEKGWNSFTNVFGRRLKEQLDDVHRADANGTAPLTEAQRRKLGDIQKQLAQFAVRAVSHMAVHPEAVHVISNTAQSLLGIDGKTNVREGHEGKTKSGLLSYLPYFDDICIPNPAVEGKCINDGTNNEHFKACEDPALAGGLDMLCCAPRPTCPPLAPPLAYPCTLAWQTTSGFPRSAAATGATSGTAASSRRDTRTCRRPTRTLPRRSATATPTSTRRCTRSRRAPPSRSSRGPSWATAATSA